MYSAALVIPEHLWNRIKRIHFYEVANTSLLRKGLELIKENEVTKFPRAYTGQRRSFRIPDDVLKGIKEVKDDLNITQEAIIYTCLELGLDFYESLY